MSLLVDRNTKVLVQGLTGELAQDVDDATEKTVTAVGK